MALERRTPNIRIDCCHEYDIEGKNVAGKQAMELANGLYLIKMALRRKRRRR